MDIRLDRAPRYLGGLQDVFLAAPRAALTVMMWRCVEEPLDPISSARSQRYAGRWHHPAETQALYTAATDAVAIVEAADHLRPGIDPVTFRVAHLRITGQQVVRLDDVAARLPWPISHLLDEGAGYARAILVGTAACRAGVDVLIVPSAQASQYACAVCFTRHAARVEVVSSYVRRFTREELAAIPI